MGVQLNWFDIPAPEPEPDEPPPTAERIVGAWTLQDGIPIATDRQNSQYAKWETPLFPFGEMLVGESFVYFPQPGERLIQAQNRVSGAFCAFRRKLEPEDRRNWTTRQINNRFVRCWRIE